jgi:hypothetical protein
VCPSSVLSRISSLVRVARKTVHVDPGFVYHYCLILLRTDRFIPTMQPYMNIWFMLFRATNLLPNDIHHNLLTWTAKGRTWINIARLLRAILRTQINAKLPS